MKTLLFSVPVTSLIQGVLFTALFLTALAPGTRADPEPEQNTVKLFLDFNKDGLISFEEYSHSLAQRTVADGDRNNDKSLSAAEIQKENETAAAEQYPTISFSAADVNNDRRLSAQELEQATRNSPRVRTLFDTLDTNDDGYLSRQELSPRAPVVELLRIEF